MAAADWYSVQSVKSLDIPPSSVEKEVVGFVGLRTILKVLVPSITRKSLKGKSLLKGKRLKVKGRHL